MDKYTEIQKLIHQKAELNARLKLIPYEGTPEVKTVSNGKYLYMRKRVGSRLTSQYVDVYSDELYQLLLRNSKESREIRKAIRAVDKSLALLGYDEDELPPRVILNIDFARANMKSNIYDQAVLEGVATTFPQTEDIIDGGIVNDMTVADVQKILNLKHAWEFILDKSVISFPSGFDILSHIAKLVNDGFFIDGGAVRGVPVKIGGTSYIPPLPVETVIKENLSAILNTEDKAIITGIKLCLFCMKAQIFNDGNKRAAVIFANHFLISNGAGMLIIPENKVPEFKQLLVAFYEGKDEQKIIDFMIRECWRQF